MQEFTFCNLDLVDNDRNMFTKIRVLESTKNYSFFPRVLK